MQARHDLTVPKLEGADNVAATDVITFDHLGEHRLERREQPARMFDRDHQAVND